MWDAERVPAEAIEAPASISTGDDLGLGVAGDTQQIIATSTTNGIPSAALAAYQRAETVINSADQACNLTWQLVAAIGRVESNHGRFDNDAVYDRAVGPMQYIPSTWSVVGVDADQRSAATTTPT